MARADYWKNNHFANSSLGERRRADRRAWHDLHPGGSAMRTTIDATAAGAASKRAYFDRKMADLDRTIAAARIIADAEAACLAALKQADARAAASFKRAMLTGRNPKSFVPAPPGPLLGPTCLEAIALMEAGRRTAKIPPAPRLTKTSRSRRSPLKNARQWSNIRDMQAATIHNHKRLAATVANTTAKLRDRVEQIERAEDVDVGQANG